MVDTLWRFKAEMLIYIRRSCSAWGWASCRPCCLTPSSSLQTLRSFYLIFPAGWWMMEKSSKKWLDPLSLHIPTITELALQKVCYLIFQRVHLLYSATSELYDRTLVYHNIMRCSHSLDILQHAELCKVTHFALSIIHKPFKISIKSDIHP